MCFSAPASFSAAALTGATGIAALSKARGPRELPLAGMPLLFAMQQAVEGILWLSLAKDPASRFNSDLSSVFLLLGLGVWPALTPLALALVEPNRRRRTAMYWLIPLGFAVSSYGLLSMLRHPFTATLVNASICYVNGHAYSGAAMLAYVICACTPLLSSEMRIRLFGAVIATGALVSSLFYYFSFVSVWCFFAALASVALLGHFQRRLAGSAHRHSAGSALP